jgi:hypothetical protein
MVELEHKNGRSTAQTNALQEAISDALASGVPPEELRQMVQTALPEIPNHFKELLPVFEEIPESLIDLVGGMQEYGHSRQLLNLWIKQGKLQPCGLLRQQESGKVVLLYSKDDLDQSRLGAKRELPIFGELPNGLIDLPAAAKKYNCKRSTLNRWTINGSLRVVGRLKAAARGGGYIVVAEDQLVALLEQPRRQRGRPRKSESIIKPY